MENDMHYVYKKEVDWSLLTAGFSIRNESQVIFNRNIDGFLEPGQSRQITFVLNEKSYSAKLTNNNLNRENRAIHPTDALQVRYAQNSELALALQNVFFCSYNYIKVHRELRPSDDRKYIKLPDEMKEYLVVYTTEYPDTYVIETLTNSELAVVKESYQGKSELAAETELSFDYIDPKSKIVIERKDVKIRRLNRAIGENLKLLYGYRCQICGQIIGEEFGSHIADAHHIDYFVRSMNNNANNQMIVCPNHHRIIHDAEPVFIRTKKVYQFKNGMEIPLILNKHL